MTEGWIWPYILLSCMHATYPSFAGCRRGLWRAALAFCGLSRFQAQREIPSLGADGQILKLILIMPKFGQKSRYQR
jgi:hypothetical protein